jgi:hypothetical protein
VIDGSFFIFFSTDFVWNIFKLNDIKKYKYTSVLDIQVTAVTFTVPHLNPNVAADSRSYFRIKMPIPTTGHDSIVPFIHDKLWWTGYELPFGRYMLM